MKMSSTCVLDNAGYLEVQLEDVWWDAGAAYGDVDHRCRDITYIHPRFGKKLVLDVVVWWGSSRGQEGEGTIL